MSLLDWIDRKDQGVVNLKGRSMEKIMVGIDFSPESRYAVRLAATVASMVSASVEVVWVDNSERTLANQHHLEALYEQRREDLSFWINEIEKQFPGIKIHYKIRNGKLTNELLAHARQTKPWFMVIGIHGVSWLEESALGSEFSRLLTHFPSPVVSVRSSIDLSKEKISVVFPVDETRDTLSKLPDTITLAKKVGAKVHVLGLLTSKLKGLRMKVEENARKARQQMISEGLDVIFNSVDTADVASSTMEYAEGVSAAFICIVAEQSAQGSNLLDTFARRVVNNSIIPVMIIHPKISNENIME